MSATNDTKPNERPPIIDQVIDLLDNAFARIRDLEKRVKELEPSDDREAD